MNTLSKKEQEYMKAARLRFKEDQTYEEIAEEFPHKPQTIRKWFSEGKVEGLKRKFSDQEKFELERSLEQDIWDADMTSKELLADAQTLAEKPSDMIRAAKANMKIREKKVELLQELGIVQKPKERKEIEETGGQGVEFNIEWMNQEEEDEQEESEDKVEA